MKHTAKPGKLSSLAASAVPASIQSQLLASVVAALGGQAANVWRCRLEPFTAEQLPATNVFPDDEAADYADTSSIDLKHRFFVRHMAQAVDGVDVAVDAQYVSGQRLILADPTLGGLARFTKYVSRKWELEKGEYDTVALVVLYETEFSTSRSDPSQPGY